MKIKDLIQRLNQLNPDGTVISCNLRLNAVTTWEVKDENLPVTQSVASAPIKIFEPWEARELSRKSITTNLGPIDTFVLEKIKKAAEKGDYSIAQPLYGYESVDKTFRYSRKIEDAVMDKLRTIGYNVKFYPNPDPGHPSSSDYWRVSWGE